MATSLYELRPGGEYTGDPIADSLAIVTRDNSAVMALADGVSWGHKSKLAANCSIYGSVKYICETIDQCANTKDVFRYLISVSIISIMSYGKRVQPRLVGIISFINSVHTKR